MASISQSAPDNISSSTAARRERTGGTRTTNSERPRTNAMSGPGLFEPGEEYVPAGIKPVVDEATLPTGIETRLVASEPRIAPAVPSHDRRTREMDPIAR